MCCTKKGLLVVGKFLCGAFAVIIAIVFSVFAFIALQNNHPNMWLFIAGAVLFDLVAICIVIMLLKS